MTYNPLSKRTHSIINQRTLLAEVIFHDGRTCREIASQSGINGTTLSLVQNGRRAPDMDTVLRLCITLQCDPKHIGFDHFQDLLDRYQEQVKKAIGGGE